MRLIRLFDFLLTLPRNTKTKIVFALDVLLCVLSVWISFYLRLGEWISYDDSTYWKPRAAAIVSLFIAIPIFTLGGFYRSIYRHFGLNEAIAITKAFFVYAIFYFCLITLIGYAGVPRTIGIIQPIVIYILIIFSRALARNCLGGAYREYFNYSLKRVMIYGVGTEGRQLADILSNSREMRLIGYIDDDVSMHGKVLNGIPIYAHKEIELLLKDLRVNIVLLAMSNKSSKAKKELIKKITQAKVTVRTIPNMNNIVHGRNQLASLREVDISDLLGREQIPPNEELLKLNIYNKVILITGAGGSIGQELCKQIIYLNPKVMLLVDSNEFSLYAIDNILNNNYKELGCKIIPLLAHVQDSERMATIMDAWKPNTIYHAAAYKHVPLVEHNPIEGISNNVFGTLNLAKLAIRYEVSNFVLISTDKAVRPTNVMGATKRLSEMILQSLAEFSKGTRFSMVRFGNVLGSSGSVVPTFSAQIVKGGPVTLTHLEVTRYFMTIQEAAQLVIQAGAMSIGGDIFILDMGEPVRISDLAKSMIELSGYTVKSKENQSGDIAIEIIGLRPGEKLFEELLISNDPIATIHPRIMKANESFLVWELLSVKLDMLQRSVALKKVKESIKLLQEIVVEYQRSADTNDWVYLENNKN